MRQTRYKAQYDAGKEHPHDLCTTSFSGEAMRDMVAKHKFDVDLAPLDQDKGAAQMEAQKPLEAVTLIFDGARGRYIPRDFVCGTENVIDVVHCAKWGLLESNAGQWGAAANPDSEWYWEAWAWILDNAEYTDDSGNKYRLHQDGDLWGLCYERMTPEERSNFGFDED